MSDQRYNPTFKQPPVSLNPVKPGEVPEELKQLDGQALCSTPSDNKVETTGPAKPIADEGIDQTEFNLFPDGALAKFTDNPGKAPTQLVVDGAGRVYCVARNPQVADLIVNALNCLHAAGVKVLMEQQQARQKEQEAQGPPLIIDPTTGGNIILPPGSNN